MTTSNNGGEAGIETDAMETELAIERNVGTTKPASSNMMNYLTGGATEETVQENDRIVINDGTQSDLTGFDNRVPLNLLPYKKDQITIEHARKTYRFRHVLKRYDYTIGLVYSNESSVTEYRAELEIMFDTLMVIGKLVYEKKIVKLATQMGIKRWDKQAIQSFSDLQQWAVHPSNHSNHMSQIEVLETLTRMFFHELDSVGRDYWLDSAVSAWTEKQKIVMDHSTGYSGNKIFERKRDSEGFVKSLFKRANLDYHISLLRRKLSDKYGVTFCRKQNAKSSIMEYRPVMQGKERIGWIGHSARDGQLWESSEEMDEPKECPSMTTSDFLSQVVEDLKERREFELAGEVKRLMGRKRTRVMVGMNIVREEDESETSPLTGGSGVQVRERMTRLKPKTYLTNTAVH
jgi:hypothetical protein